MRQAIAAMTSKRERGYPEWRGGYEYKAVLRWRREQRKKRADMQRSDSSGGKRKEARA